ncbi:MAG: M2 family metallopeptidase [Proteobacteria bacterium]|nr:M2 family metallopeptidase [Pseudomonadota bacterium]
MNKVSIGAVGILLGAAAYWVIDNYAARDATSEPTAETAVAFIAETENTFQELGEYAGHVFWIQANFFTHDSNWLVTKVSEEFTSLGVKLSKEASRYNDVELDFDTRRKMDSLRRGLTLPAPDDPEKMAELAEITTGLESTYAFGKYNGLADVDIIKIMATSRDEAELKDVWQGWRTVSPPMRDDYARMVEIANQGSQELGFADTGALWREGYDMPADEFTAEADRLWGQVQPLYESLHCYVRDRLVDQYGDAAVTDSGMIPAHLLGNIWAQQWGNVFPLVAEGDADPGYDLTQLLVDAGYDEIQMVKTGEAFFTSLGFEPMPETFWERSLFTKPQDRIVQCHASAWDIDDEDFRIKMCIDITGEDFNTIHHELGHNFYQRAYKIHGPIYQGGANDGFHEAIGDFIALSITPNYLVQLGLLDEEPDASADIGLLLSQALDKIAFLPFSLVVDQWRWKVFSGEISPENYNAGWWALREQYQGVTPPVERTEADFDPGAKYHIPGNVPYMRYFLAHILQFQFHKAACDMAGWQGPVHRCTIYGNKEVGDRLNTMLEMGSSKPWPDALEAFTGTREMDGSAILAYFAPLKDWLDEKNAGKQCGWDAG